MGRARLTKYLQFSTARRKAIRCIYSPLKDHTVHFTDHKQDLRPAQSTVWKAAQTAPQGGFPMYFLMSFMVLLRQSRRLYISGSIFQVLLVYNYSTCRTNRVLTRFNTLSTRLRVRAAYASNTLLKHQLRGEVRQYIDHIVHFNRIDSHHRLNEYTILYVFRAPRHDSLVPLNWYKHL